MCCTIVVAVPFVIAPLCVTPLPVPHAMVVHSHYPLQLYLQLNLPVHPFKNKCYINVYIFYLTCICSYHMTTAAHCIPNTPHTFLFVCTYIIFNIRFSHPTYIMCRHAWLAVVWVHAQTQNSIHIWYNVHCIRYCCALLLPSVVLYSPLICYALYCVCCILYSCMLKYCKYKLILHLCSVLSSVHECCLLIYMYQNAWGVHDMNN